MPLDGTGNIQSAGLSSSFCSTAIPTCLSRLPLDIFTPCQMKITPTIPRTMTQLCLHSPCLLPVSQICKASSPQLHTHTSSFSSALLICSVNISNNRSSLLSRVLQTFYSPLCIFELCFLLTFGYASVKTYDCPTVPQT